MSQSSREVQLRHRKAASLADDTDVYKGKSSESTNTSPKSGKAANASASSSTTVSNTSASSSASSSSGSSAFKILLLICALQSLALSYLFYQTQSLSTLIEAVDTRLDEVDTKLVRDMTAVRFRMDSVSSALSKTLQFASRALDASTNFRAQNEEDDDHHNEDHLTSPEDISFEEHRERIRMWPPNNEGFALSTQEKNRLLDEQNKGEKNKTKQLLQWMNMTHDLNFYITGDEANGRTLRAARNLSRDENVFEIPRQFILTTDTFADRDWNKLLVQNGYVGNQFADNARLCVFLLLERFNESSFWKPWLDVLPHDYSFMPVYFDEEELKVLQGSHTLAWIRSEQTTIKEDWDYLRAILPHHFANITLSYFVWARHLVTTRVFGLVGLNATSPTEDRAAMSPLIDLMNHKSKHHEVSWVFDIPKDKFLGKLIRDLEEGGEVFTSYGTRSNVELLAHYGFALVDNPFNEAAICLSLHPKQGPTWEEIQQGHVPPKQIGMIGSVEYDFIPGQADTTTTTTTTTTTPEGSNAVNDTTSSSHPVSHALYDAKMKYITEHFSVLNPKWGGCENTPHRLFRCKLTHYVHDAAYQECLSFLRIAVANASEFHAIVSSNYTSKQVRTLASVSLENELRVSRIIARQSEQALHKLLGGNSYEDLAEATDSTTSERMKTMLLARKAEKEVLEIYTDMDKQVEKYALNPPKTEQEARFFVPDDEQTPLAEYFYWQLLPPHFKRNSWEFPEIWHVDE